MEYRYEDDLLGPIGLRPANTRTEYGIPLARSGPRLSILSLDGAVKLVNILEHGVKYAVQIATRCFKCSVTFQGFENDVHIVAGCPQRCWHLFTATLILRRGNSATAGLRFKKLDVESCDLVFDYMREQDLTAIAHGSWADRVVSVYEWVALAKPREDRALDDEVC